ncbi:OmpA family protein [Methylobacterium sp. JK268]
MIRFPVSRSGLPRAVLASALILLGTLSGAGAQGAAGAAIPTEDEIAEALSPPPRTRGLTLGVRNEAGGEGRAFLDTLRNRAALSDDERQRLAAAAADRPSIDLDVPFGYGSAQIGPQALPVVKVLGATLARPQFSGSVIMIAGHTDARGPDRANQALSERRAEAVKQYIVRNYGVPAANLVAVGYGRARLKDPAHPLAAENRRVTAVNMSAVKAASRE